MVQFYSFQISEYTAITIFAVIASFVVLNFFSFILFKDYSKLHWFWTFSLVFFGISTRILGYFLYDFPTEFSLKGETTVLGGIVGLLIISMFTQRSKKWYYNTGYLVPSLLCLHIVGKIACFAGGCCYGTVSSLPWSIHSSNTLCSNNALMLHPTQIYELILFLFPLIIIFIFSKYTYQLIKQRLLFPLYGLYYSVERFIIEFFRGDAQSIVILFNLFTLSQFVALIIFFFSLNVHYFI